MSDDVNPDEPDYGADQIRALKGIEGIRQRPEMYIGTTDTEGLHHLVYELVTNSIDEALAGHATMMSVTINADGSCTVVDDGRGIPVGPMAEHEGKSALEVVFTNIHSGGKFDRKSGYVVGTGGLHGVGIKAVNACSEWVEVEVRRDDHVWRMEFAEGDVSNPLTKLGRSEQTGTKVTFKPDTTIFQETSFSYDGIHRTLQDTAFLNPGLRILINDERSGQSDEFYYEDGLIAYVKYINRTETPLYSDVLRFDGSQLINEGTKEEGTLKVDIALQHNDGYMENVRCYANGVYNADGGTHLSGIRGAITRALNGYASREGLFKDVTPSGEDFREGLAGVVSVHHPDPKFASNQKRKFVNTDVTGFVENVAHEGFSKFLEEHPAVAKAIIAKAKNAAEAREAARKAREMARASKSTTTGGLPDKLRDCRSRDLARTEIYLVEGDSAGGSADTGRDSETQAILPLRGKILNVEKAQLVKILGNAEVANIFKAIGIPPQAEETDIAKRRYGKLVVMTDADVDGSHIRTLLLTFLFRHMRELVKEGCVYIAQPPLYRVLPKSAKKKSEPRYVQTHEEMMSELLELGLSGSRLRYLPDGAEAVEFEEPKLRELVDVLGSLEEPLEMLDRRGVDVKHLATTAATADGKLPRYRVFLGGEQHWFAGKPELDAFLSAEQEKRGEDLRVADQSLDASGGNGKAEAANTLQLVDLHEVRSINRVLDDLAGFGFDAHALYQPDPREGEPVFPFRVLMDEDREVRVGSLRDLLSSLRNEGEKGLRLTRFKGLGEMDSDELWATSMDPETRTLIQVTMADAAAADEIFRVLMGDHVEPRREFIEKHALDVKELDV